MEHKTESKLIRMANRKADEARAQRQLETDENEEAADGVLQKVAKAASRPVAKIKVTAKDLPVGTLAIAYGSGAQQLVKVLATRIVKIDPEPWIKVQLYASANIRNTYNRAYNPG